MGRGDEPGLRRQCDSAVDEEVTQFGPCPVEGGLSAGVAETGLPTRAEMLNAAITSGEIRADISAYELMRGVGNLCIFAYQDTHYDARRLTGLLITGLTLKPAS